MVDIAAIPIQQSSLNLVFHFADKKGLPLVDLERSARR